MTGEVRYEGPAIIATADGSEVTIDVLYWVEPVIRTSLRSWSGVFTLINGDDLEVGDARLRLPDGRAGNIVVTDVSSLLSAPGSSANGRFSGAGAPPN